MSFTQEQVDRLYNKPGNGERIETAVSNDWDEAGQEPRCPKCDQTTLDEAGACVNCDPDERLVPSDGESQPTITVSMSRKINMGNYESADCFVSINGVRAGMTVEEMAPLLETAKLAWDEVRTALAEQVRMTRPA